MRKKNQRPELFKNGRQQLLKLVTKSFYKELINYGIESGDIVTVSMNLLDLVTEKDNVEDNNNGYYNKNFSIDTILDQWQKQNRLRFENITISPLEPSMISQICEWLQDPIIKNTLIDYFPKEPAYLAQYFFDTPDRFYFGIYYGEDLVGFIGADNLDQENLKLEMKKFVGASGFSGKGIGKRATFLFLYYAFIIKKYNKVYIHSMDTNIRNININTKFGFELEGVLFHEFHKDNHFYDVVRMGLLKNEWEKRFS